MPVGKNDDGEAGCIFLTLFLTGDWKVPGTRTLESVRYVAQAFQPAGSGDFPVACSCLQPNAFTNSVKMRRSSP